MKTAIKLLLICLAVNGTAYGQATEVPASESKAKTKVLLIGKQPDHPWGTHMYMHVSGVLAKCLKLTDGVEAVVSNGWPKDSKTLEGVKTIVVYSSPAAEYLMDGPHAGELDKLMKQGVGLVTIHWASSVLQQNLKRLGDRFISYMGGVWVTNVVLSTTKSELRQLAPKHPICRGWSNYELLDEYYLNPTLTKAATPMLEVTTKGQKVVVGWAYERPDGKGRAYATTLGHFYRNFQMEAFRRTIVNAILWTAHVEVPVKGAPVNLSEADLKLPPMPQKAKPKK